MCVIVYKPAGSDMVGKKTLKRCFEHNPDGAGYMLARDGKVVWKKGFMTFDSLRESLKSEGDLKYKNVVIHFRITTQGGVQQALCHPFPVCSDYESMRALTGEAEHAIAHNGIIHSCSSYMVKDHNDTMEWIRKFASPVMDLCPDWRDNPTAKGLIENLSENNKFAIMDGDGSVTLVGDFIYDKDRKCWFSNLSYMPYVADVRPAFKGKAKKDDANPSWSLIRDDDGWRRLYPNCDPYDPYDDDDDFLHEHILR